MTADVITGLPTPKDEWDERELAQAILTITSMEHQGKPIFDMAIWTALDHLPLDRDEALEQLGIEYDEYDVTQAPDAMILKADAAPPCGTTMCIAGWATYLTRWQVHHLDMNVYKNGTWSQTDKVAHDALGLKDYGLFYTNNEVGTQFLKWLVIGNKFTLEQITHMDELHNAEVDITNIYNAEQLATAHAALPPVEG